MRPFETIDSTYVCIPAADVDTDQIVPARFLRLTDRDGLGAALFADWRARELAAGRRFVLDAPAARMIVAGRNFGCGSSRAHAVWALQTRFRALLAPSLAEAPDSGRPAFGLYEPVHGSAPDLAGRDVPNPLGAILSAAMLLRHSLGLEREATAVERAVSACIDRGLRTADMTSSSAQAHDMRAPGDAVVDALAAHLNEQILERAA